MNKFKIKSQKKSLEVNESILDELLKLADLNEKGVVSEETFLN